MSKRQWWRTMWYAVCTIQRVRVGQRVDLCEWVWFRCVHVLHVPGHRWFVRWEVL